MIIKVTRKSKKKNIFDNKGIPQGERRRLA
jgi:hypothetical protein